MKNVLKSHGLLVSTFIPCNGSIVFVRNTGDDPPVLFEKPELPMLLKEVLAFY
jgi:hypothetical protein